MLQQWSIESNDKNSFGKKKQNIRKSTETKSTTTISGATHLLPIEDSLLYI